MCTTEILMQVPPLLWANNGVPAEGPEHIVKDGNHYIPVDACIVPVVQTLWDAGIVTLSSCCGHAGPDEDYPWGVITIQTKPGVAQRGATVVRRERYEELLKAEADLLALKATEQEGD